MDLTKSQSAAATVQETPVDTCVVAGPGSGKTTVLVKYFERLVAAGTDPLRILAITFTDKAANNMRERLVKAFQDRPEIRAKLERAYVSTVHGFCTRLLKENAVFAGVDPEFTVMDERESDREQRLAVDAALDGMFEEQPDRMRALMRGLAGVDAGSAILDVYDAIRAAGTQLSELDRFPVPDAPDVASVIDALLREPLIDFRFAEVRDQAAAIRAALDRAPGAALRAIAAFDCNLTKLKSKSKTYALLRDLKKELLPELEYSLISEYYAVERATILDLLARFDRLYRERKQQLGALDYDDLQDYTVRLLESKPDVRGRVRAQFDQVLMDEFQDTNGQQAKLLELLRPPDRFYAVGDINQSIYGFRHAAPEEFHKYRQGAARVVELVENFRSRPEILRAVETITASADGVEPRELVAGLNFAAKDEPSVEVLCGEDPRAEAQLVASRIADLEGRLQLRGDPAQFRDFAVLVRNTEVLPEFTSAFEEFGIPYLVQRGKGFYETREVVDLTALLRVIVNPLDEIAMATVLRSPFVQESDETLLRWKTGAAVDTPKMIRFHEQLARWRAQRDYTGIDHLLARAMDECGYECASARAMANVEKFLAQARAAGERQTLAEFVEDVASWRASNPREPDAPPEDSANAVKLMTVHSAKGLEFPVVFLAAMHKGIETGPGNVAFLPGVGLGARWTHPFSDKDKDDAFLHAIRERLKQREMDESNRLLYVAMTRAEEHLVLSFVSKDGKYQNWAKMVSERLDLAPRTTVDNGAPAVAITRDENAAAVQILDRPAVEEQFDSQANITSIAMFADCPRKYYLSRYLGFEASAQGSGDSNGDSDLSASEFGLQVHALLAGTSVAEPQPDAVKLAQVFQKSPLARRAAAATKIEREFDFLMEIEGVVLRGQIDLWFEDDGKIVLVDYKTDRLASEKYALQLHLYALALERHTGRAPDEAYLYFLRPNVVVPVDLRPSLFSIDPEAAVREFREAQERQRFPLKEGEHCKTCPHFKQLCPAGAQ